MSPLSLSLSLSLFLSSSHLVPVLDTRDGELVLEAELGADVERHRSGVVAEKGEAGEEVPVGVGEAAVRLGLRAVARRGSGHVEKEQQEEERSRGSHFGSVGGGLGGGKRERSKCEGLLSGDVRGEDRCVGLGIGARRCGPAANLSREASEEER